MEIPSQNYLILFQVPVSFLPTASLFSLILLSSLSSSVFVMIYEGDFFPLYVSGQMQAQVMSLTQREMDTKWR